MAQCSLDLSHPAFQRVISAFKDDPGFSEGLQELKRKVEAEHTSCNRVVQPMPKYPDCQNKIWKYDWSPAGARSAHRKSWRIVVIVAEPTVQPYRLIAVAVYAKNQTAQLSTRELARIFAAATKPTGECSPEVPERFHHVKQGDGDTRSLCMDCGETVAVSFQLPDIEDGQNKHLCDGNQLDFSNAGT